MRPIREIIGEGCDGPWDSLFQLKAITAVEEALGIQFETKDIVKLTNLAAIEKHLASQKRMIKAIVCDLDGVLWQGVLGEDGVNCVKIGQSQQSLHTVLLEFKRRGVLLAICSKNEIGDVEEIFSTRPEMLLRIEDFCSVKVGWDIKALAVEKIAEELHLGYEHICFLDDSPQERQLMRDLRPAVLTPELGTDPRTYPMIVEGLELGLDITTYEDRNRTAMMLADQERVKFSRSCAALDQVISVEDLGFHNEDRAVQLCARANQFHLDLKRWTKDQLTGSDKMCVWVYSVRDRFGDAGRVAVAGTKDGWIELLVVSCRVLGRGVENWIIADLVEKGASKAMWMPGIRNQVVYKTFLDMGWSGVWVDEFGPRELTLVLGTGVGKPSWIKEE